MKGNIGSCHFQFNQKTTKMVLHQHCVSQSKKVQCFQYFSDQTRIDMYSKCSSCNRLCTSTHSKKREIVRRWWSVLQDIKNLFFSQPQRSKAKGLALSPSFPAAKSDEKSGGHDCTVTDTAKGFSAASYVRSTAVFTRPPFTRTTTLIRTGEPGH